MAVHFLGFSNSNRQGMEDKDPLVRFITSSKVLWIEDQ